MNIDQILSKYRSICSDLDADIKEAAQKIKMQKSQEKEISELPAPGQLLEP